MIRGNDKALMLKFGQPLRGLSAWMGNSQFPRLVGAPVTTDVSTATTTPAINIGSPTSGEMVLVLVRGAGGAGVASFPAGWTQLVSHNNDASDDPTLCGYRRCDGTEGATISLTYTGTSTRWSAVAFRMTNAGTPALSRNVARMWNAGTFNAEENQHYWGVMDSLWFALAAWEGNTTVSTYPSGHTLATGSFICTGSSGAGVCTVGWAIREQRAARQPAVNWAMSATAVGTTFQIQVPPGGSGG